MSSPPRVSALCRRCTPTSRTHWRGRRCSRCTTAASEGWRTWPRSRTSTMAPSCTTCSCDTSSDTSTWVPARRRHGERLCVSHVNVYTRRRSFNRQSKHKFGNGWFSSTNDVFVFICLWNTTCFSDDEMSVWATEHIWLMFLHNWPDWFLHVICCFSHMEVNCGDQEQ